MDQPLPFNAYCFTFRPTPSPDINCSAWFIQHRHQQGLCSFDDDCHVAAPPVSKNYGKQKDMNVPPNLLCDFDLHLMRGKNLIMSGVSLEPRPLALARFQNHGRVLRLLCTCSACCLPIVARVMCKFGAALCVCIG